MLGGAWMGEAAMLGGVGMGEAASRAACYDE